MYLIVAAVYLSKYPATDLTFTILIYVKFQRYENTLP